ncbi:G_PROTEIN_RECEP_F1_2 domain-containing protein [Meloidogyne graminicola]|uniref:G_PROTEIN_RECEP_F1_2 domain-containing protein n=1 Tax=Meloidogyne graminicola TaxID=189291 RepID=A0A8S9ZC09_9BILA|nr:G_PROTEIN_RECEP_F1_2 domain-containing protein [Meloidogyne graminicola]
MSNLIKTEAFGRISIGKIFFVCIITAKYSSSKKNNYTTLKSKTSILLALASSFEILHQFSHIIFLNKIIFFGMDFIPFKQAFLIQIPSLIGLHGAVFMLITLGVDRLLAVLIPIRYRNFKQFYYIIIHVLINTIYISYALFMLNIAKILTPNWMVTGGLGDFFTPPLEITSIMYYTTCSLMLCTIIIYLLFGIIIKYKTDTTDEKIKKIFRSISLIILINIGGYFICNLFIALLLLSIIKLNSVNIWFWNNFFGIFLNIAAASIGPILYFNSEEYRLAYKHLFNDFKKFFKLSNSTIHLVDKINI